MEIKLSKMDDPVGFVLGVLKKQASALEVFQTNPREGVALIYAQNSVQIDECHRDVNVAWNRIREAVIRAGNAKNDLEAEHARAVRAVTGGVHTCQKVCDLFDDLCQRYGIPENEPHLFLRIGTVLHP